MAKLSGSLEQLLDKLIQELASMTQPTVLLILPHNAKYPIGVWFKGKVVSTEELKTKYEGHPLMFIGSHITELGQSPDYSAAVLECFTVIEERLKQLAKKADTSVLCMLLPVPNKQAAIDYHFNKPYVGTSEMILPIRLAMANRRRSQQETPA